IARLIDGGRTTDGAFWFALEPARSATPPTTLIICIDPRGRISAAMPVPGERVEAFAADGDGIFYSGWIAPDDGIIRSVAVSPQGRIILGTPYRIKGGGGDIVVHHGAVWFVPDANSALRRLSPGGTIRTVRPAVLVRQTIINLATDGDILWCTTLQGWLYAFSFANLDNALN
ncbi:MAG TPA: hypothetical protein VHT05_00700, partial [Candidatus Elarobacter sp.]|nr:hypothetical protein [Candidatus Elarobacter sp.]